MKSAREKTFVAVACAAMVAGVSLGSGCARHCDVPPPEPITPTGPPGSIHVHVEVASAPATIVAEDSSGVQQLAVPPSGDLSVTITPPAIVTAVRPDDLELETITGVEPGDQLCFMCSAPFPPPSFTKYTTLAASPYPGAGGYRFRNGEDQAHGVSPSASLGWGRSGPHDLVAVATSDDTGISSLAWAAAPAQALVDGGTVTMGPWQPLARFTASYDHLPDDARNISVDRAERSSLDVLPAFVFSGLAVFLATRGDAVQPATNSGAPLMTVDSEVSRASDGQQQQLYETVPAALTYHVDAATEFLPWLNNVTYDACAHRFSWNETAGATADGVWLSLEWMAGPEVDARPAYGHWDLLVPAGVTSVTLPDSAGLVAPPDSLRSLDIDAYELEEIASYASMRAWNHHLARSGPPPRRHLSLSWSP